MIVSVVLHAIAIAFLIQKSMSPSIPGKKGVISVDFIEPVRHHSVPRADSNVGSKKPKFRAPEPEVEPPPQAPVGSPEPSPSVTNDYIASVLKIINQRKVYPQDAIDRGEEGRVVVGVSLAQDGKILDVRIEEACPFTRLNNAAVQTVERIKNFPALPLGIAAPIHLHIPLVYRVESQ